MLVASCRRVLLISRFPWLRAEHLEAVLEPLGKRVRNFFGSQGSAKLPKDTYVAVCTFEKANSLINKLLVQENRLSEVCLIVIDELHMVGDRDIGGTSWRFVDKSFSLAASYETGFRPVPLEEYIKVGITLYNPKMEIVRGHFTKKLIRVARIQIMLLNYAMRLSEKGILCWSSVLVAGLVIYQALNCVPTKGQYWSEGWCCCHRGTEEDFVWVRPSSSTQTLPSGVAYHHAAGLTAEEREVVEQCFKQGVVRVLSTATSTLAAGAMKTTVSARVGVNEPFLMRVAHGGSMGSASKLKGIPKSPSKREFTLAWILDLWRKNSRAGSGQ